MGEAGIGLIEGIDVEEIVDRLDGYYCYNLVVMYFSPALHNRLEAKPPSFWGTSSRKTPSKASKLRGSWRIE